MPEIMKATVPVFIFLVDPDERVYLQRRYQTGYLDGFYEPPAGKMDVGEFPKNAAARELYEETGALIQPDDLELFHAYMNTSNKRPWLGLMFRTRIWQGTPMIKEPEKCDHGGFFALDSLPNVTPQVRDGLARLLVAQSIEISTYDNINTA